MLSSNPATIFNVNICKSPLSLEKTEEVKRTKTDGQVTHKFSPIEFDSDGHIKKVSVNGQLYIRVGLLGSGWFGDVYQFANIKNPRDLIAIKQEKKDTDENLDQSRAHYTKGGEMKIEASIWNVIYGKGAVAVDLNSDLSPHLLLMECIQGQPLDKVKFISEEHSVNIILAILTFAKYMHDKNVVHGDLRLSNILIQDNDGIITAKLVDFGFSRLAGDKVCGIQDQKYHAPELRSRKLIRADKTQDFYGFGYVLQEYLRENAIVSSPLESIFYKMQEHEAAERLSIIEAIKLVNGVKPELSRSKARKLGSSLN